MLLTPILLATAYIGSAIRIVKEKPYNTSMEPGALTPQEHS